MVLIFCAACCSVLVSILLKNLKNKGFNPLQMIAWNYFSASALCYLWFQPNFSQLDVQNIPWWLILILGILLPSIFLCLAKALQFSGIVKTEIAQRLSVLLSLLAAYFIFEENFDLIKLTGLFFGLSAIIFILMAKNQQNNQQQGLFFLVSIWFGYALVDILLKYMSSLGIQFPMTLNLMFLCSLLCSMTYILFKFKNLGSQKNIVAGLFLGVLNFANIVFYLKAHLYFKDAPAIVFAGMNIFVVLLGLFSGIFIFKEKLDFKTGFGLSLGILSILTLAYAI